MTNAAIPRNYNGKMKAASVLNVERHFVQIIFMRLRKTAR